MSNNVLSEAEESKQQEEEANKAVPFDLKKTISWIANNDPEQVVDSVKETLHLNDGPTEEQRKKIKTVILCLFAIMVLVMAFQFLLAVVHINISF